MQIGVLQRTAIVFTGIVIAFAVILCVTPVGAAPANQSPAVYTGVPKAGPPKATQRADKPEADKPAEPKPKPKADRPKDEPKLAEVTNAAGERLDVSDGACKENLAIAAKRGLTLPDGWAIQCVGPGLDWSGNSHWGVTCPYDSCPEGAGPYVSISNPTYYVVAHELCHANNGNDELAADACAADHGASLAESPYQ